MASRFLYFRSCFRFASRFSRTSRGVNCADTWGGEGRVVCVCVRDETNFMANGRRRSFAPLYRRASLSAARANFAHTTRGDLVPLLV